MLANDHAFTATGKIKRPSYSTVATWVKESWDDVSVDLIKKSFKCCGVSTKLDGSEDNQLFDYDKVLDSDEEIEGPEGNEEYPEEDYHENDWNIGNRPSEINDKVDDEDSDENGESVVDNRRKEKGQDKGKGKGKEKENETEDEYSSSDDEDIRRIEVELKKKYKRKNY